MHQACRIRPFRRSDLPQLQTVASRAFAPVFQSVRRLVGEPMATLAYGTAEEDQNAHLEALSSAVEPRDILVVEVAQKVVGFGHVALDHERKIGEIGINAIDPMHQGKGYGEKLHSAMLDQMRAAGMKAATVGTGADDTHAPARAAYAKVGFTQQIPSIYLYRAL
ncbi:MAG: GNAT family N-acetyltransferase [Pseudomonadota bacterium]